MLSTVLRSLDNHDFSRLCIEFQRRARSARALSLEQFQALLRPYFPDADPAALAPEVAELFALVDREERRAISWEDFSHFLVDATLGRNLVHEDEAIAEYRPVGSVEVYSGTENLVRSMKFIPGINKIFSSLKNMKGHLLSPDDFSVSHELPPIHNGVILDAEFMPFTRTIVTTAEDCIVRAFREEVSMDRQWVLHRECRVDNMQDVLRFHPFVERLYSAGRSGDLMQWLPFTITKPVLRVDCRIPVHADGITDVAAYQSSPTAVTCSLDKTVALLDLRHGSVVRRFEGHEKGVFSVAVSEQYGYIISGGFEFHACCFVASNADIDPVRLVDHLHPHSCPLLGVWTADPSPQVVTCDVSGLVKVWDLRTLRAVSTFTILPANRCKGLVKSSLHSFTYLPATKQFAFNSRNRTYLFEYSDTAQIERYAAHPRDQHFVAALNFEALDVFVTAASREWKVWAADDGRLLGHFPHEGSDITAVAVFDKGKHFLIGNRCGTVIRYSHMGGVIARYEGPCPEPIASIAVCNNLQAFACVHDNGFLCIWKAVAQGGTLPLVQLQLGAPCLVAAYCPKLRALAVGDTVHQVHLFMLTSWVLQRGYLAEEEYQLAVKGIVSCVAFLAPRPALLCADTAGELSLWAVPPHATPGVQLLAWVNRSALWTHARAEANEPLSPRRQEATRAAAVLCMSFSTPEQVWTGDESGYAAAWDLHDAIEGLRLDARQACRGSSTAPPPQPLPGRPPPITIAWKAHNEGILQIQALRHGMLLTASAESKVSVWQLKDDLPVLLGRVCQAQKGVTPLWLVDQERQAARERERGVARATTTFGTPEDEEWAPQPPEAPPHRPEGPEATLAAHPCADSVTGLASQHELADDGLLEALLPGHGGPPRPKYTLHLPHTVPGASRPPSASPYPDRPLSHSSPARHSPGRSSPARHPTPSHKHPTPVKRRPLPPSPRLPPPEQVLVQPPEEPTTIAVEFDAETVRPLSVASVTSLLPPDDESFFGTYQNRRSTRSSFALDWAETQESQAAFLQLMKASAKAKGAAPLAEVSPVMKRLPPPKERPEDRRPSMLNMLSTKTHFNRNGRILKPQALCRVAETPASIPAPYPALPHVRPLSVAGRQPGTTPFGDALIAHPPQPLVLLNSMSPVTERPLPSASTLRAPRSPASSRIRQPSTI
eukprot:EG_transcript_666